MTINETLDLECAREERERNRGGERGVGKFWERGGRVKTKVNMNRKFRAFELKGV